MGDVYVDEIGDRIADYSLLDMTDLQNGEYEVGPSYVLCVMTLNLLRMA